jgi:hypothetical protein
MPTTKTKYPAPQAPPVGQYRIRRPGKRGLYCNGGNVYSVTYTGCSVGKRSTPTSRPNDAVCLPLVDMSSGPISPLKRVCENRGLLKAISIRRHEYAVMKAVPQGLKPS